MRSLPLRLLYGSVFAFLALLCLLPFAWTAILGTHSSNEIYTSFTLLPGRDTARNFATLMVDGWFAKAYLNSVVVTVSNTAFAVIFCAMAGFAFAKYRFPLSRVFFAVVLTTMMIPVQLGLVAFVWEMYKLRWVNTFLPLILPGISNAFGVFWMKQYIEDGVPDELLEAARMDGSSALRSFVYVVLPIVLPASLSFGLVNFIWTWNGFLVPSLIIDRADLYTLPLMIRNMGNIYRQDYGAQFLGISLGTIPTLALFVVMSRRLIEGITAGALKG